MKKALVRCRCGHQVLAREVLRTDLYERSMGREYVYVKFRCKRCKRMGEAFVAENRWDWSILEPAPGEMNSEERDRFLDAEEISDADVEEFHRQLESLSSLTDLAAIPEAKPAPAAPDAALPSVEAAPPAVEEPAGESATPPGATGGPVVGGPAPGSSNPQNIASNNVASNNVASNNVASNNVASNNVASNNVASNNVASNAAQSAGQTPQKRPSAGDEKRPRS